MKNIVVLILLIVGFNINSQGLKDLIDDIPLDEDLKSIEQYINKADKIYQPDLWGDVLVYSSTDPYLDKGTYTRLPSHIDKMVEKISIDKGLTKADTIIFATAHKDYRKLNTNKLKKQVKPGVRILDLWNIFEGKFEQEKDFEYIGLGRGDLR